MTAGELRDLLEYDSETGVFRWKQQTGPNGVAGSIAGSMRQNGYWRIGIADKQYSAHRLVWLYVYGEWPESDIDHVNRCRSDNRLENLRLTTASHNQANTGLRGDNVSGHKGVTFHRKTGRWQAQIKVMGRNIYLGLFDDQTIAGAAYQVAARQHFGDFAA